MYPKLYPSSRILANRSARLVSRMFAYVSQCLRKLTSVQKPGALQQLKFLLPEVSPLLGLRRQERGWPQVPEAQECRHGSCDRYGVPNFGGFKSTPGEASQFKIQEIETIYSLATNVQSRSTTATNNQMCLMSNVLSLNQNIYTTDEKTILPS